MQYSILDERDNAIFPRVRLFISRHAPHHTRPPNMENFECTECLPSASNVTITIYANRTDGGLTRREYENFLLWVHDDDDELYLRWMQRAFYSFNSIGHYNSCECVWVILCFGHCSTYFKATAIRIVNSSEHESDGERLPGWQWLWGLKTIKYGRAHLTHPFNVVERSGVGKTTTENNANDDDERGRRISSGNHLPFYLLFTIIIIRSSLLYTTG